MCIIQGQKSTGDKRARDHYNRGKENSAIATLEIRGFSTEDPDEAMRVLDVARRIKKIEKPLYIAIINPAARERLSDQQFLEASNILERHLGLLGHQRIIKKHTKPLKDKKGHVIDQNHEHIHVIWNRYPPKEGEAAVKIDNHYAAHQKSQKEIEQKFGLIASHPLSYNLKRQEIDEAKRHGFNLIIFRKEISDAYLTRESAESFRSVMTKKGVRLCVGDKRQVIAVLPWGRYKALSSLVEGRPRKADIATALETIIPDMEPIQAAIARGDAKAPRSALVPPADSAPPVLWGPENTTASCCDVFLPPVPMEAQHSAVATKEVSSFGTTKSLQLDEVDELDFLPSEGGKDNVAPVSREKATSSKGGCLDQGLVGRALEDLRLEEMGVWKEYSDKVRACRDQSGIVALKEERDRALIIIAEKKEAVVAQAKRMQIEQEEKHQSAKAGRNKNYGVLKKNDVRRS